MTRAIDGVSRQRQRLGLERAKCRALTCPCLEGSYDINGTWVGDLCIPTFCLCCSTAQLLREVSAGQGICAGLQGDAEPSSTLFYLVVPSRTLSYLRVPLRTFAYPLIPFRTLACPLVLSGTPW